MSPPSVGLLLWILLIFVVAWACNKFLGESISSTVKLFFKEFRDLARLNPTTGAINAFGLVVYAIFFFLLKIEFGVEKLLSLSKDGNDNAKMADPSEALLIVFTGTFLISLMICLALNRRA